MTTFAEPITIPSSRAAEAARAEPPRMDVYASIHKAMRSFMADTVVRIGSIDVAGHQEGRTENGQRHREIGRNAERLHLRDERVDQGPGCLSVSPT